MTGKKAVLYTGYALSASVHTANSSHKCSLHVCLVHVGILEFASRKQDTAKAPLQLCTMQPCKYTEVYKH